jgi:hypothetical protein
MWLSTSQNVETKATLEELSMQLMEEARALEKEVSIPSALTK